MSLARVLLFCVGGLLPLIGAACESAERRLCKKQLEQLVAYRANAMDTAFGDLFLMPERIEVKFYSSDDERYGYFQGRVGYDAERRVVAIPVRLITAKTPNPLRQSVYYWPYYEDGSYRDEFKIIGAVDNALWTAYLQEAAKAHGQTWPHAGCASVDVNKRLPCEMLAAGVVEHLTAIRMPLFNENRLDMIWPERFADFQRTVWLQDSQYENVRRYGGILLLKPLIAQFGVPRALAYVAQTPFEVHEGNLRLAALRYQRQAREVLGAQLHAAERAGEPVAALFGNH